MSVAVAPATTSAAPLWTDHADGAELDPASPGEFEVDNHAPWSPDDYDGQVFTTDAPDLTDLPTVHAVYLYPADMPSRFAELAPMFQADARQSSDFLTRLYGRGVRFDERAGTNGRTYLDITVVQSQFPAAALAVPNFQFGEVVYELERHGLDNPDKKYAVWLDAPSSFCGQAQLRGGPHRGPSNGNEQSSVAIVYRNVRRSPGGSSPDAQGGGFCRGRVLLHELGHAFGALQDEAPNEFDGAHCMDSPEDVMCYRPPALLDTGPAAFDYRNDDYWDPRANPALGSSAKLPWWTVNLSRFVCPAAGCAYPNSDPGY